LQHGAVFVNALTGCFWAALLKLTVIRLAANRAVSIGFMGTSMDRLQKRKKGEEHAPPLLYLGVA